MVDLMVSWLGMVLCFLFVFLSDFSSGSIGYISGFVSDQSSDSLCLLAVILKQQMKNDKFFLHLGYKKRVWSTHDSLVRLVADKEKNKPRGYAFIEYMHTRDMKAAYKQADGRKLDNRRVLVDVELAIP
ncbi:hypothetical protein POM88_025050 [Heracleum sosnowskyi]|uniref:RRM domain-containing protein n=1 Tax=Heracleum sosnowskyi TaxID=360622 RepID=A0AAD8I3L5_9APIA|nr:hypothetical protein POM88_025050 [Heracleum sosnowskyi]